MNAYRAVWLVACAAVVLVGVGVGLVLSPTTLGGTFFLFAGLAAMSTLLGSRYGRRRLRVSRRRVIGSALAGGAVAGAAASLEELLGVGVLALGILLLSVSPYVLRAYVRALTSVPVSMAAGLGAWVSPPVYVSPHYMQVARVPDVRLLTEERLSGAWRTSFLALQSRPPTTQALATVEERQRYLDEFERRNPRGFAAWLASEAWASNIPVRYLRDAHMTRSEINWDEVTRQQDS
jgi:hypothetical protein